MSHCSHKTQNREERVKTNPHNNNNTATTSTLTMMFRNVSRALLLCLTLLVDHANSFFFFANKLCGKIATQFVQDAVCTCDFGVSLKSGIGLNAECIFPEPIDIENDANLPLRGTPSFSGDYSARGIRESMVGFAFEDIIGYTIDAPFPLSDVVVDINMGTMLIDLTHGKRFKIEECQATYNNEACKSCTPCENGYSIKFDCSNVSLYNSPFGAIFFPFFTDCVGAGAPQSVNGPANSVQAFVPGIPM